MRQAEFTVHENGIYRAAARLKSKRACDLANADCRKPPKVHEIDVSGYTGKINEVIAIEALATRARSLSSSLNRLQHPPMETGPNP